jgi:predicted AAA+ superfamily ATPase
MEALPEIDRIEVLVALLAERSGTQLSYSSLAGEVQVSVDTMRRWLVVLGTLHHGFLVRPWFKNVARSLRKEPKWYCTDWSTVADPGRRAETLVAVHLLKAVHLWTDLGFGR